MPGILCRAIVLIGVLAMTLFSPVAQAGTTAAQRPQAALETALADAARWEIAAKALPSVAIALVDRRGLVWSGAWGFADADRKVPARVDGIYRAGSVSKLFTDVAVMRLVEQGRLDLDAPVTRYLPGFHPRNPFGGQITLRELMTHRSGLVREPPRGHYFDDHAQGQADTVASLNETALVVAPGTVTKYSNAGLAVVGEVLARVTGKPYEQAVRDLVLAPLGMTASAMTLAPVRDHLAHAEMASFDGPRFAAPAFDLGTPAAGNLYTNLADLARFATMMLDRGTLDGRALLRPASVDEMWRPQVANDDAPRHFGLGFILGDLDGQRMVGHSGAVYGFSTEIRLLPEAGLGAIVFSTVDSGNTAGKLVRYALHAWLAARAGAAPPAFATSEPVTGEEAKRLSGRFVNGQASVGARIYDGQFVIDGPEIAGGVRRAGDKYLIEDAQAQDDRLAFAPDGGWLELDGARYMRATQAEPPPPAPELASLIGEYGWRHNILRIYERDRQPWVRIEWVDYRPLRRVAADRYAFPDDRGLYPREALVFERDASGRVTAALLNGIRWPRRDFGAEAQAAVRHGLSGDIGGLRARALAATPPVEAPKPRAADLVSLPTLDPAILLDIRYAGTNNFMGVPLYQSAAAYMQRPAAEAVARVSAALRARGYGLLIHDAYRPWFVTKMFWDATPPENHQFVADPAKGSRHNRGAAVDLTMYSLASGAPIVSTGRYDEFSDRSYSNYVGGSDHERWVRDLLRGAMEAQGFSVYPEEWWHFDFARWPDYPIGNTPFEALSAGGAAAR